MLHQNDWDDLHKKAAEKYPLNTGNSNWKAVEKLLKSENDAEPEILSRKRYIIFFSILTVLLTSVAGYLFISKQDIINSTPVTKIQSKIQKQKTKIAANYLANKSVTKPALESKIFSSELIVATQSVPEKNAEILHAESEVNQQNSKAFITESIRPDEVTIALQEKSASVIKGETQDQQNIFSLKLLNLKPEAALSVTTKTYLQPVRLQSKSVFYAGLFLSREMSYVRSYQISQGNIGYGLLLGFNINRHLSIETGLSKQKKNFSTPGNNFSTDNLMLRPTTKLLEVKGYFKTTDIPVNLRYNFNKGKLGQFFATTGLSTLVLHRQYYDYSVEKAEGTEILQRSYPAIKKDNKLFSQVNISAGYEKNVGRIMKVRIEPFYQLPLNNIGLGKVYLSTAGLNVGIVKNF